MKTLREDSIVDTFPLPDNLFDITNRMENEIVETIERFGLNKEFVEVLECKEKFNQLRCYIGIPILLEDFLTDKEFYEYSALAEMLDEVVDKYERESRGIK